MTYDSTQRIFIRHSPKDACTMVHDSNGMLIAVQREPGKKRGAEITDTEKFRSSVAAHEDRTRGLQWLREESMDPLTAFICGLVLGASCILCLIGLATVVVGWM